MPTIQQLVRKGRKQIKQKSKSAALIPAHNAGVYVLVSTQRRRKNQIRQCVRWQGCVYQMEMK